MPRNSYPEENWDFDRAGQYGFGTRKMPVGEGNRIEKIAAPDFEGGAFYGGRSRRQLDVSAESDHTPIRTSKTFWSNCS